MEHTMNTFGSKVAEKKHAFERIRVLGSGNFVEGFLALSSA
jgi:hypothetical protein